MRLFFILMASTLAFFVMVAALTVVFTRYVEPAHQQFQAEELGCELKCKPFVLHKIMENGWCVCDATKFITDGQ